MYEKKIFWTRYGETLSAYVSVLEELTLVTEYNIDYDI